MINKIEKKKAEIKLKKSQDSLEKVLIKLGIQRVSSFSEKIDEPVYSVFKKFLKLEIAPTLSIDINESEKNKENWIIKCIDLFGKEVSESTLLLEGGGGVNLKFNDIYTDVINILNDLPIMDVVFSGLDSSWVAYFCETEHKHEFYFEEI